MEGDGVWIPLTPGKPALTSERGPEKENMDVEFPLMDGFDSMHKYKEKCVLNKMCELPAGILDELEAENKKARGVDESRDGIGSIPTPSKTKETRKRRNDGNDINKKPSQRPRVKKHRPKIYDDSKPKKVPKAQTPRATPRPKTPKPSTPNRVQERRTQSRNSSNRTQKSTSFGNEHVGQDVREASRAIVRSCKRFLDFDHFSAVKESKSHEQPPTLGFDFEKFDCFRGKIVTSKRSTTRRSKFQNKSLNASDNLVIDNKDICVTRNQEQVDKYGRKYVHFYQRRKKISHVSTTATLLVYRRRSFSGNQCLYNSRKCGPVFPKLFKKYRTMRKKVTIKVNQWYVIADEFRKNLVKRSRKLAQRKNVQNRVNKSKGKKAVMKSSSQFFTDEFLSLFLQSRRKRSIRHTRFNQNILNFPYDLENSLIMHTRFNENIAKFPYFENDLLCQEENFLDITEDLPLYDVSIQRIKSFTSPSQDFPRFDNYFGNMNWFQLQEVAVYGNQSLPPQHKDLNEFKESEVEYLIWKMASLDIKDQCKELVVRNQNLSGALVKIPPKKRKQIPKVDLDTETLRVWKLLMENDGSEPVEETDKDKEAWWETQRSIFRGRVDSFIAKMHLIQGNRRFSPWKGSVTDSVVGVYLTQNVTDHLSSSAFMSMAARFPAYYRSKKVDDDFEVPSSHESVADVSDAAPPVKPNQNPFQGQDRNDEMEHDVSGSYADVSDVTPMMGPNQNQLQVQDTPCVEENSSTFRKFLEAEEENYLKQFCRVEIDESESCISENKPSAITCDLNVSLFETSEGKFMGQQKSTPPICSPQSEVTTEQGVVSENNHKYTKTPLENEPNGQKKNKKEKKEKKEKPKFDWDKVRKTYCKNGEIETNVNYRDTVDWEAVRCAPAEEIAKIIEDRGMHNVIAGRIKEFLDRMYEDHGTLDLEWLRDVPPDTAKEFLLSIEGLGLKSVECVRLLTLHHNAFPVDTNVGRVATRLGWVPLQPLPDSVQLHLLNAYPMVDNIQKYLYPRLCTLDQKTLYELHYQLITFGKVFCTKIKPNCNACPMRAECRHYASEFASGRLALPGPKESSNVTSIVPAGNAQNHSMGSSYQDQSQTREPIIEVNEQMGQPESSIDLKLNNPGSSYQDQSQPCEPMIEAPTSSDLEVNHLGPSTCEPIIEVPPSPEPEVASIIGDIEDLWCESDEEIPTIRLNTEEFKETLKETMDTNKTPIPDADLSKALIAFSAESENIRVPPKKFIAKSRTMHLVYELPDFHPCLAGFEERDPDDPTPYLLAVWFPGEVTNSLEYTENRACVAANNNLEETVKATVLIPCRTATRGSFPLNGTYFQVNEVFADDETSHASMDVPRRQLCNLPLRELGCGSSATSIFKALSTGAIQRLFWRGSICVRGFNRKTRQPKQLNRKFHISTSVVAAENRKSKRENKL